MREVLVVINSKISENKWGIMYGDNSFNNEILGKVFAISNEIYFSSFI